MACEGASSSDGDTAKNGALQTLNNGVVKSAGWDGPGREIVEGELVILYAGIENTTFAYVKRGQLYHSRYGRFHHDDIIGKRFGSKVVARDAKRGWMHVLPPTPELWAGALPTRTQICQDWDQSIVVLRLGLKPGDVVVESGTGSGAMSAAILRTIAPTGHLHTFEFNEHRAKAAKEEFVRNGLGGLVTVTHRDVCGKAATSSSNDDNTGGFRLVNGADAVFLDLPEPWLAVAHARKALKRGRPLASYSPCIEQVSRTCNALRENGFHSVTTVELRLRQWTAWETDLPQPDFGPSPVVATATELAPLPAAAAVVNDGASRKGKSGAEEAGSGSGGIGGVCNGKATGSEAAGAAASAIAAAASFNQEEVGEASLTAAIAAKEEQLEDKIAAPFKETPASPVAVSAVGTLKLKPDKKRPRGYGDGGVDSVLCGKPLAQMRGHTAFLTFAVSS